MSTPVTVTATETRQVRGQVELTVVATVAGGLLSVGGAYTAPGTAARSRRTG